MDNKRQENLTRKAEKRTPVNEGRPLMINKCSICVDVTLF